MSRLPLLLGLLVCAHFSSCAWHRIEQSYFLGVFDPQEQLPTSLYRVRLNGKSHLFNSVNYAAGWAPANFVDSLGSKVSFDLESGSLEFQSSDSNGEASSLSGRRLMLFGPEGFREAPADQRLVVVMANDPSEFFKAIDDALGTLSAAKAIEERSAPEVRARLTKSLLDTTNESLKASELLAKVKEDTQ